MNPLNRPIAALTLCFAMCTQACGADFAPASVDTSASTSQNLSNLYMPSLGVGVDFAETKTFGQCVTFHVSERSHGMAASLYDEVAIRDRHELNSTLNIEGSASAKGMWGSGVAAAGYFKNVQMSGDAFYWLVYADYKLRERGLDLGAIALTPAARQILAGPRGLAGFYEACGEYFYSGSQQSATYALLYEFKSAEEKTIDRIKAAASYDGFGVKAKADFERFSQMAVQSSVLKVHAASTGGSERLRSYATSPDQLEEELAKLRDDLYNRGTGVETKWYAADYNMFPEVQEAKAKLGDATPSVSNLPKLIKDFALTSLYRQYVANVDVDQRIRSHLERGSGAEPLFGYGAEKRQRMRDLARAIETQNLAIAQRAKRCMIASDAADCATSEVTQPPWGGSEPDELMQPDSDFTTLQGWSLMMAQNADSKLSLDFVGHAPNGTRAVTFATGHSVMGSPLGVVARADEGPEAATVIGTGELVRDPVDGQLRPNVCVYRYQDLCSLRIVPLAGKYNDGSTMTKLQVVLFDSYGFVQKKLDFPSID